MTESAKIAKFGPIVARCRSAREPDTVYEVRRAEAGTYSCNCRGWATRKRCKHTAAAEGTEGRSGIVDMGRNGRTVVQQERGGSYLRAALDSIADEAREAVTAEAAKAIARASRPVLIVRATNDVSAKLQRAAARIRKMERDPIQVEAMTAAKKIQTITGYYTSGPELIAVIEAAIRKFASTWADGVAAEPAAPFQGERGVREIVLE